MLYTIAPCSGRTAIARHVSFAQITWLH